MPELHRTRLSQILREAEGYLELNLPQYALRALERAETSGGFRGQLLYLRGEALRSLERYGEAIEPLAAAAEIMPSNIHIWLALGWCYKRTERLDLAIDALRQALATEPSEAEEALVTYNLACYLSLAGQKDEALANLAKSIAMNERYRELVHSETDFDPIRSDPGFQALASIIV